MKRQQSKHKNIQATMFDDDASNNTGYSKQTGASVA